MTLTELHLLSESLTETVHRAWSDCNMYMRVNESHDEDKKQMFKEMDAILERDDIFKNQKFLIFELKELAWKIADIYEPSAYDLLTEELNDIKGRYDVTHPLRQSMHAYCIALHDTLNMIYA